MAETTLDEKIFALREYDELLKIRPNDADLWVGKARVCLDLTSAMQCYNNALSLRPPSLSMLEERVKIYKRFNEKSEAIQFCDDLIKKNPHASWAWYLKGFVLKKFGEGIKDTVGGSLSKKLREDYEIKAATIKEMNLCFREAVRNKPDAATLDRLKDEYAYLQSGPASTTAFGFLGGGFGGLFFSSYWVALNANCTRWNYFACIERSGTSDVIGSLIAHAQTISLVALAGALILGVPMTLLAISEYLAHRPYKNDTNT